MQPSASGEPPMFIRVQTTDGVWYDVAIADISAIEVPARPHMAVHVIVGGLHAVVNPESYPALHAAWVTRRRSAAGR